VSNNGSKTSTPRTADDTAPILVPDGAGIWTFGDHLRHLAGHAGTTPLARLLQAERVSVARNGSGSKSLAGRGSDPSGSDRTDPALKMPVAEAT
jgi:hypothetical protein